MTPTPPPYVIKEASGNPIGEARQWAWLLRVLAATSPTPPVPPVEAHGLPPARQEQPTASRAG